MKSAEQKWSAVAAAPSGPAGVDEGPGLPWLRTWRRVYGFVFAGFVLNVLLLALLSWAFS